MSTLTGSSGDGSEFRPILDRDVMIDILADHASAIPNREVALTTKEKRYQDWAAKVATRTFDYGYRIFDLTKKVLEGNSSAETELYLAYTSLLSEVYRESFDSAEFIPGLPHNVVLFLQQSPSSYEPLVVAQPDFSTQANLSFKLEERHFDQQIQAILDIVANLLTRALAVKYTTCSKLLTVRINAHVRDLAKVAVDLISGHQMVMLYGATNPAVTKVKDRLRQRFYDEAGRIRVLEYMEEGKMFSDDRFQKDQKAREILRLMTGLFDLKPLYL